MRLLLAEDDPYLGAMLAKGLREHAYAVDVVDDGAKAVIQAAVYDYDLVVLDVMMPKRDGFSVCREMRRRGSAAPVLMLTARDAAIIWGALYLRDARLRTILFASPRRALA